MKELRIVSMTDVFFNPLPMPTPSGSMSLDDFCACMESPEAVPLRRKVNSPYYPAMDELADEVFKIPYQPPRSALIWLGRKIAAEYKRLAGWGLEAETEQAFFSVGEKALMLYEMDGI